MKQNLVVFLADMYNVLEIHPVKCVRYPGEERAMQYLDGMYRSTLAQVLTRLKRKKKFFKEKKKTHVFHKIDLCALAYVDTELSRGLKKANCNYFIFNL